MLRLENQTSVQQAIYEWVIDLHITNRHVHNVRLRARVLLVLISSFEGILFDDEVIQAAAKGPHINSCCYLRLTIPIIALLLGEELWS